MSVCRMCGKEFEGKGQFCDACPRPLGWASRVGMRVKSVEPEFTAAEHDIVKLSLVGGFTLGEQVRLLDLSRARVRELRRSVTEKVEESGIPVDSFAEAVLACIWKGWIKYAIE